MADGGRSSPITLMLSAAARGDPHAAEQLLPLVYDELRRLAGFLMQRERVGMTLQPTALVHEAYLRIVSGCENSPLENRRHFFNTAARAMRRILIDRHRRVNRTRHGGGVPPASLDAIQIPAATDFRPEQMDALEDALKELERLNQRWSEVVHLRYFAGLTIEQTADVLGISIATVKNDWSFARAWLHQRVVELSSKS